MCGLEGELMAILGHIPDPDDWNLTAQLDEIERSEVIIVKSNIEGNKKR